MTPSATPIVHVLKPNVGEKNEAIAHDLTELNSFEKRNIVDGDNFRANLFERPFTAGEMNYLPYIDIKDFIMSSDTNWYFIRVTLSGMDENRFVHGTFGVDFDLNVDGRAEVLMFVDNPFLDWSTDRVSVYLDGNGDIGGFSSTPEESYSGDGYEVLLFQSGAGIDPDLAWARLENGTYPKINLAIKRSFFRDNMQFMWSVFASEPPVDPSKFYLNDTLTEEQAGSPAQENKNYPVKDLSAFDNTCRMPVGFKPTGREPMGCTSAGALSVKWTPGDINWCQKLICP